MLGQKGGRNYFQRTQSGQPCGDGLAREWGLRGIQSEKVGKSSSGDRRRRKQRMFVTEQFNLVMESAV